MARGKHFVVIVKHLSCGFIGRKKIISFDKTCLNMKFTMLNEQFLSRYVVILSAKTSNFLCSFFMN